MSGMNQKILMKKKIVILVILFQLIPNLRLTSLICMIMCMGITPHIYYWMCWILSWSWTRIYGKLLYIHTKMISALFLSEMYFLENSNSYKEMQEYEISACVTLSFWLSVYMVGMWFTTFLIETGVCSKVVLACKYTHIEIFHFKKWQVL